METHLHKVQACTAICDCQRKDYEQEFYKNYSKYIGEDNGFDKVVGLIYHKDEADSNLRPMVILECTRCGVRREVSATAYVAKAIYKKCNCRPKTRTVKNPLERYNQIYLNKTFGNLKIIGFSNGTTLQNTVAYCQCKCGKDFHTMLANIVSGDTVSCGFKTESLGEIIIRKYLDKRNVYFTTQQKMNDLVSKAGKYLKFDFMIFDSVTHKGIAVIEYDGPHHYLPGNFYGNAERLFSDGVQYDEKLRRIQENDKIKEEYVAKHDCKMYRILSDKRKTEKDIVNEVELILQDISKNYNCFKN